MVPNLPVAAYMHRDGDQKDEELIELMRAFEDDPENPALVIQLIQKRIEMKAPLIAEKFLEYGRTLPDFDEEKAARLAEEIQQLSEDE